MTKISLSRVLGALGAVGLLAVAGERAGQGAVGGAARVGERRGPGVRVRHHRGGRPGASTPQWLFPFEAVSLLLLVAMVGAVVVAKPRI